MNNPNHEPKPADKTPTEQAYMAFIRLGLEKSKSEPIPWKPDELQFATISTDVIDDNAIRLIFEHTVFENEDDITESFAILEKYRPELCDIIAIKMFGEQTV